MYPDLSYLFHDIFGTAQDNWTSIFKTFGMFLALAFLTSGYVLYLEFKRKEAEGIFKPVKIKEVHGKGVQISDLLINFLFWFFFAFKIAYIFSNFQEFQDNPAGVFFSLKGNWFIGFIVACLITAYRYYVDSKTKTGSPKEVERLIYPHNRVTDITFVAAISGVLGSRLFSILENMEDFLRDPIGQIFSGSGLTIYGGLILAFIVVSWYVRKKGMSLIHVMDAVAPTLIIGYAVGRIGCQIAGDGDWGIVNELAKPSWFFLPDWMWAYDYPHNVADSLQRGPLIEGCDAKYCTRLAQAVFPTPIYETIASIGIFGFLWGIRKKVKVAGVLFFIYLTLNGIERFFIEFIRVNPRYDVLGMHLSLSQFIALAFIIGGIAGIWILKKRSKTKVAGTN
jgi:prolipoprotein diacylglyceryl transferase